MREGVATKEEAETSVEDATQEDGEKAASKEASEKETFKEECKKAEFKESEKEGKVISFAKGCQAMDYFNFFFRFSLIA